MLQRRHITALIFLIVIIFIGTCGFMIIGNADFIDALYMTIITLTTVGFKEVVPLNHWGQLFTIGIIFMGMGTAFYLIGSLSQMLIEGQLRKIFGRRKLENKIRSLKNHIILCGYGRIGEVVCQEIMEARTIQLVIIENDPNVLTNIEEAGYLYIPGDATDEDCLIRAGISRAKALVTALNSDANNVYITLTARNLNPDIFILARSSSPHTEKKLLQAGGNKVISPYYLGGKRMAQIILSPTVAEFIDFALHDPGIELNLGEISVMKNSSLQDVSLIESGIRQKLDLIIVAIKKCTGEMIFNPGFDTMIECGDTLIAVGNKKNLLELEKMGKAG